MFVKDYMTKELVTITPQTSIMMAQDLMRKHDINRLPVLEGEKLLGIVTRESISKGMPSEATSLSVYELNYLLDKMTVVDVMIRNVKLIAPDTLLTEAASTMAELNIGVMLIVEQDKLVGIITDKDIFKAFIDIAGYHSDGTTLVVELDQDKQGVIEEIGDALVETDENLTHLVVYHHEDGGVRLAIKINHGHTEAFEEAIKARGYQIHAVVE